MNTTDLMVFMVSMAVCTGAAALLGYFAFRSLRSAQDARTVARNLRNSEVRPTFKRSARQFPGVICALPMHQVKRADAPMTDIWSR